ncbi:MAG: zf-HC2 domain-containing protein [Blastocatellia bacterium]
MNSCDQIRMRIFMYLDNELPANEQDAFLAHLAECAQCRQNCEQEQMALELIRGAHPLYTAPPGLRARVRETLRENLSTTAPQPVTQGKNAGASGWRGWLAHLAPAAGFWPAPARMASLALVLLVFLLAGYLLGTRQHPGGQQAMNVATAVAGDFVRLAVDAHLRRLRGQFPLEINSASPINVSEWFSGKLSFSLQLPAARNLPVAMPVSRLEGGRLIEFRNAAAALIGWQIAQRPVTLLVASSDTVIPAGAEQVTARGLTFHYQSLNGYNVITWTDRGLTYALVSDMENRGQNSCVVCHENPAERALFESFTPPAVDGRR